MQNYYYEMDYLTADKTTPKNLGKSSTFCEVLRTWLSCRPDVRFSLSICSHCYVTVITPKEHSRIFELLLVFS